MNCSVLKINKNLKFLPLIGVIMLIFQNCGNPGDVDKSTSSVKMILDGGGYPYVLQNQEIYYFLRQGNPANTILLYSSDSIDSLSEVKPFEVWNGPDHGMSNIWSPEIYRINGNWLIYFEADNGNTDNHQLYVLMNDNENPMTDNWDLHGPIITDTEWNFGIHPSSFMVDGKQYLLWSGWEHRRAETETQCIFIAEMENPWTLKSERVLLSKPEFEWERQWINPDGSRSAYPIFVNENPEALISPDGKKVIVVYSASGIWTPYSTVGLIYADADSNLLDPHSWTKLAEPQSPVNPDNGKMVGISNISVADSPDGTSHYVFFQGHDFDGSAKYPHIYFKEFSWNDKSLPDFKFIE